MNPGYPGMIVIEPHDLLPRGSADDGVKRLVGRRLGGDRSGSLPAAIGQEDLEPSAIH